MNDLMPTARAALIEALGLLDSLKSVGVRPDTGTREELYTGIDAVRLRLEEVIHAIDDAEGDSTPNCGARNR